MEITINGQIREVPEGTTLLSVLETIGLDPSRVAVELDREIVKQPAWAGTVLAAGAQVEIVQFVGGG